MSTAVITPESTSRRSRSRRFSLPRISATKAESLVIFLLFTAGYVALGYRVVIDDHVVVFDALDRLLRAYMVWHNAPPKLTAVGFQYPPFTSLAYLPLAVVKPLCTTLIAVPLFSGVFAAATMVILNRGLAFCHMAARRRYPILLLFGANPLFAFYASNGESDAFYLFLLAAGLFWFMAWYATDETRYLVGAGLAFAIGGMTRYELFIWAIMAALLVTAALVRKGAWQAKVEGTLIAFLTPIAYAVLLWCLFNMLIVGDPIGWLTHSNATTLAVDSHQFIPSRHVTIIDVTRRLLQVSVSAAPLGLAALPVLILVFIKQRDDMALSLAGFIALGFIIVGADAILVQQADIVTLDNGLVIALAGVIGAAWLYRSIEGARWLVWAATVGLLALSVPLVWHRMQTYPYQDEAQAFTRAVSESHSQEGTSSIGGLTVGISAERRTAAYIKRVVGHRRDAILTDNAQTYAVMLLTGRPEIFYDRVDRGDATWRSVLASPYGKVRFLLVAQAAQADLIRRRYPDAAAGNNPALTPVYDTGRYVLLRVAARGDATATSTAGIVAPAS